MLIRNRLTYSLRAVTVAVRNVEEIVRIISGLPRGGVQPPVALPHCLLGTIIFSLRRCRRRSSVADPILVRFAHIPFDGILC